MTVIHYSGTMSGIMDGLLESGGFTIKVQDGVAAAMPKKGGYGICGIKGGKIPCLAHARDERGDADKLCRNAGKAGINVGWGMVRRLLVFWDGRREPAGQTAAQKGEA